jgi:hypothetical protein
MQHKSWRHQPVGSKERLNNSESIGEGLTQNNAALPVLSPISK